MKSFFTDSDAKVADYKAALGRIGQPPGSLGGRFDRIGVDLDGLAGVRTAALGTPGTTVVSLINRYGAILSDLDAYVVDAATWVAASGRSRRTRPGRRGLFVGPVQRGRAAGRRVAALTAPGGITRDLHEAYVDAYAAQTVALTTFNQVAPSDQTQIISDMVTGDSVRAGRCRRRPPSPARPTTAC